jgi:Protein of unknown function (DUF3108)
MVRTNPVALGMVLALSVLSPKAEAAEKFRHEMAYSVSLSGILLAKAKFLTEIENTRAKITGSFRSAGIASVFKDISGDNVVEGHVAGRKFDVRHYASNYVDGKNTIRTDITYANGNVKNTAVEPVRKDYPDNWVKIMPEDLKMVSDPVSGFIVSSDQPPCSRTVRMYDGESRLDLTLYPKGEKPFKTEGFDGKVLVCGVKFRAKAGFRADREDFANLARNKRIEIWYAKAESVKAYAPVYVTLPIDYGQLTVKATHFGG